MPTDAGILVRPANLMWFIWPGFRDRAGDEVWTAYRWNCADCGTHMIMGYGLALVETVDGWAVAKD